MCMIQLPRWKLCHLQGFKIECQVVNNVVFTGVSGNSLVNICLYKIKVIQEKTNSH